MKGSLKITLINATFLKDKDIVGKMDAYVQLEVGNQKQKSHVAKNMGTNPVWNQQFDFNIDGESNLKLEFYDDDIGNDDQLGQILLGISQFDNGIPIESSFSIYDYSNKVILGQLRMRIKFDSVNKPIYNGPAQTYNAWGN